MPFAGFKDFGDCVKKQMKKTNKRTGKPFTKEDASRVCGFIQKRAEGQQIDESLRSQIEKMLW